MSIGFIRVLVVAAVALLCGGALSTVAAGRTRTQPQLTVSGGTAHVITLNHAQPVLSARFSVANAGPGAAPLVAWIELTAAGHTTVLHRYSRGLLRAGHRTSLTARLKLPRALARRNWAIQACVVPGTSAKAKPVAGGCRRLGGYDLAPKVAVPTPTPPAGTAPSTSPPTSTTQPAAPTSTSSLTSTTAPPAPTATTPSTVTSPTPQVPTAPVAYTSNQWFFEPDGRGQYDNQTNDVTEQQASEGNAAGFYTSGYWAVVPPSYDTTNRTPETLVVWMHGCYGSAEADSYALTSQFTSDRPYILISLNGPESEGSVAGPACWDSGDQTDVSQVLADITNAETHFNIDRRRVIIAGYSSGGDLAWLTMFTHAATFAGILAANTNPVRDNAFGGNGIGTAIAGAAWKFPGIQLSHGSDDVYHVDACSGNCPTGDPSGSTDPDVGVRPQITALDNAGFNVTLTVKPGNHYNADVPANCSYQGSPCTGGTSYDIVNSLLSTVGSDGWEAPALS